MKLLAPAPNEIRTERLVLRRWREEDLETFAALQSDPQVRRFFLRRLPREEAIRDGRRHAEGFDRNGFDLWVLELAGEAPFIGIAGVRRIGRPMPFTPLTDVGWMLFPSFWGQGFAAEAARAALRDAFERTDLESVVAYTTHLNRPSQRVMMKLGMTRDPDADFSHPDVPEGSPLQPHVLYRLARADVLGVSASVRMRAEDPPA
jgi:RimJ/RimL family protein N-acetyltransferase